MTMHRDGFEVDEGVGFEDAEVAIVGGADEVARERGSEGAGIESEGGDSAGVIDEGSNLGRRCEVIYLDGVVGATGCCNGAGGGDGLDRGDVRGIGEDWG